MVSVIDGDNFVLSLIVTIVIQLIFYAFAVAFATENLYDFAGGLNYVIVFVLTIGLNDDVENVRGIVLTALVSLSRVILAGFLLYRVLSRKGDARFEEARQNPLQFLVYWVFQMLWVFLISSPVIYVNGRGSDPDLGAVDYVAFAFIAFGIIFQLTADLQKYAFRADKANRGKVCDIGVWSISRHPNYFGEVVIWWGAFMCAVTPIQERGDFGALWVVVSPLFTMFLLLFVSGIPLAEGQKLSRFMKTEESKEAFLKYFSSVPPLIPCLPVCYAPIPSWAKCLFCCEFPFYAYDEKQVALKESKHDMESGKKDSIGHPVSKAPSA
ncbi:hypothetical protein AAMO2058_000749500 [Amorphochlora amoebiformis]|mmetsp:Transcript_26350/g.41687  ORF Transcript_26350/g.41687 Transcript_26350/m.41687 type:complete len:325 (-) Transcript_26350:247-1221(-)